MTTWLVVLIALAGPARAQDDSPDREVAAAATAAPALEVAWLTATVTSTRFHGERVAGPELPAGTEVKVLVRDGSQARVMAGTRFGWVDAAVLSATEP